MYRLRFSLALAATLASLTVVASAAANTAPVCNGFSYNEGHVDQPYGTTVGCSDADAGTRLRYTVVNSPAHGTVSPGWSYGIFVYKPAAGYIGDDSFTVRANDGEADSAGLFTVQVSTKADAAPQSCTASSTPYPVRTNGAQVLPLGWVICLGGPMPRDVDLVTGPAHGTLSGPSTAPVYSPDPGYEGADQITYRLRNAVGASAQLITWSIQVSPTADIAPQCLGSGGRLRNDTTRTIDFTCYDPDIEPVSITIGTPPQHGTLSSVVQDPFSGRVQSLQPFVAPSTAHVVYTPNPGYAGPDSFTTVADDGRQTTTMTQNLTVDAAAANQAPTCSGSSTSISDGSPVVVFAGCTDPDGDAVTTAVVTPPAHGTLGSWSAYPGYGTAQYPTYTPDDGFLGADLYSIQATDSHGASSAITTIPITIVGAAFHITPPTWGTCSVLALGIRRNTTLTTPPLECPTMDGAPASVAIETGPTHGQATLTPEGALRFVPAPNYVGGDGLTLRVTSAGRTMTIPVTVAITSRAKTKILTGPPATSTDAAPAFTLYAEPGVTLTCALSSSAAPTPTPCAGTKIYAAVPAGDHVLTVTATDAQSRTTADTYVFTITDPSSGGGTTGGGSGGGGSSSGGTSSGSAAGTGTGASDGSAAPTDTAPVSPSAPTAPSTTPSVAKAPSSRAALAAGLAGSPKRAAVLRRGVALTFAAPAAGRISVRWYATVRSGHRTRQVLIGSGSRVATTPADGVIVTVALTAAGRHLLKAATDSLKVRAVATFTPKGGAPVVVTRTLTLG
jgi:hypothetical protein